MSITVRLWSDEDLTKIGKDPKLTTIFMNVTTFSATEIKHYPYHLRKQYRVFLDSMEPDDEPITVYATSPAMAKWFISQEYNGEIAEMHEIITKVKRVSPKGKAAKKGSRKLRTTKTSLRGLKR